jgi:TolA-binding protein
LSSLSIYNCPSPEALSAYANDDLAKAEIRRIEMHVLECPLCSEAIELYMQGEAKTITAIDKSVSQYIDNQYDRKIVPIWKRVSTYGIAASFLLVFGAMYFLAKPKENNLAEAIPSIDNQTIKVDTITQVEPKTLADNSETRKEKTTRTLEKPPILAEDRAITTAPPPAPQAEMMQAEDAIIAPQVSAKPTTAKIDITQANDVVILPQRSVPAASKKQPEVTFTPNSGYPTQEKDVVTKAKKSYVPPDLLRKGTAFYKTNNFAEATKVFKEILADEPNNQSALYFLGLSEQGRGFYQNAIEPFSKIETNNQNYSEAQYQLALSYLEINKLAKAKAILQVLSESENPRKAEALQLLKQL